MKKEKSDQNSQRSRQTLIPFLYKTIFHLVKKINTFFLLILCGSLIGLGKWGELYNSA